MLLRTLSETFTLSAPRRRRARRSSHLDASLEQRSMLCAMLGGAGIVDAECEAEEVTEEELVEDEGDGSTFEIDCSDVTDPAIVVDDPQIVECFGVDPESLWIRNSFGPVVEETGEDKEENPIVYRYLGPPIVEDVEDEETDAELIDEVEPDEEVDPQILYSTTGGRGADDNGEIPPNFRGGNRPLRQDRRQARKQEKDLRQATQNAHAEQKKTSRSARRASRRAR
jgi:hypothetical protein